MVFLALARHDLAVWRVLVPSLLSARAEVCRHGLSCPGPSRSCGVLRSSPECGACRLGLSTRPWPGHAI